MTEWKKWFKRKKKSEPMKWKQIEGCLCKFCSISKGSYNVDTNEYLDVWLTHQLHNGGDL